MSNVLRPSRNALAWVLSSVTNSPIAGVGERSLPAAVGEGLAGILLGSPGRLHHAIEGEERLHGQLHVDVHPIEACIICAS